MMLQDPFSLLLLGVVAIVFSFTATAGEISLVIEPFEDSSFNKSTHRRWDKSVRNDKGYLNLELTKSGTGFFGGQALQTDYEVFQTENWGGFVTFGWMLKYAGTYNCIGASHLSLYFRRLKAQSNPGRVHLRLIAFDNSNCTRNCDNVDNLETYYSFHYNLDSSFTDEWVEITVPLVGDSNPGSPFWRTGWGGIVGNDRLDPNHLKSFRIEFSMDSQGEMNSSSNGSILLDHLSCVGSNDDALDWPFRGMNGTYDDAVRQGLWSPAKFSSFFAKNHTQTFFRDGMLHLNFTLRENVDRISLLHHAPEGAYYNLSQASQIRFDYQVLVRAESQGHAYLGITLEGVGDGEEIYYKFPNILNETTKGIFQKSLNLSSAVLDSSKIKGFRIELGADSQESEESSIVTGYISIGRLVAVSSQSALVNVSKDDTQNTAACSTESDLLFVTSTSVFEKKEFLGGRCCDTCDTDENCLFAFSSHVGHCYIASELESSSVAIPWSELHEKQTKSFVTRNARKRGDYCQVCECIEVNHTIDCHGRNLSIAPKTFSQEWIPEILDLTDNPRLVLIDSNAFEEISNSLKELRLPGGLRHLSPESVKRLSASTVIEFESSDEDENHHPKIDNVITESSDFFLEVCCGRGVTVGGLTFCDMQVDKPGIDAIFEPFVQYIDPDIMDMVLPSSSFLSEAAESAEKCAEYCAMAEGCHYFSYDGRWAEAEHRCYLLRNNGTRSDYVCCKSEDYSDENMTASGWTSGWPPRTRHDVNNARLITSPVHLVVNSTDIYVTQYNVSLGHMPKRGAVWIDPILSSTTELSVHISPQHVALYDITPRTVTVTISDVEDITASETLLFRHQIHSCDAAFTAAHASHPLNEDFVYIDVQVDRPQTSTNILLPLILASVVVVLAIPFVFAYLDMKRRRLDSVWSIKSSELNFGKSPEIIGRGTFGVVLLAEYHGTLVAVKRVVPQENQVKSAVERKSACKQWDKDENWKSMLDGSLADSNHVIDVDLENSTSDFRSVSLNLGMLSGTKNRGVNRGESGKVSKKESQFFRRSYSKLTGGDSYSKLKADFVREMRILSKLRHPCITPIIGAVVAPKEEPLLVMEYMNHGSLYNLLHNVTFDIQGEQILPILRDAAQGIRFLHATTPQVVHGDIKAQNILVSSSFRAKVCDFGLSHTRQSWLNVVGTPYWMAPELLRGESGNTAESDVFSFGIMLYEVYSRRDPYEGEDYKRVLQQVRDPVTKKRPIVPESMPPAVGSMMARCLMDSPIERPTFEDIDQYLKKMELVDAEPQKISLSFMPSRKEMHERFPPHIVRALEDGAKCDPESRELVTICFASVVRLSEIASLIGFDKTRTMIERLNSQFAKLAREYDVFEVETIGDSYMVASNLAKDQSDHAERIVKFASKAIMVANETLIDADDLGSGSLELLVGLHSGPVVASVVGSRDPRYCLSGDTVNTAFEIHAKSLRNRIHCSEFAARLLRSQCPEALCGRGKGMMDGRGKGKKEIKTYFLKTLQLEEMNASEARLLEELSVSSSEKVDPSYAMPMTATVSDDDTDKEFFDEGEKI